MKQYKNKILFLSCMLGLLFCFSSCREDLLNQVPAGELSSVYSGKQKQIKNI